MSKWLLAWQMLLRFGIVTAVFFAIIYAHAKDLASASFSIECATFMFLVFWETEG